MTKEKKKMGRPHREYDSKTFEGLCHVQCTVNEIEAVLRTDQRTLDTWCQKHYGETFSTCYKKFAEGGKASLRRDQFKLARTNASVNIWLSKQFLGQKDNPTIEEVMDSKLGLFLEALDKIGVSCKAQGEQTAIAKILDIANGA